MTAVTHFIVFSILNMFNFISFKYVLVCVVIFICVSSYDIHHHGGVPMGKPNMACDTGKEFLSVDWANETTWDYACQPNEDILPLDFSRKFSVKSYPLHDPIHKCMRDSIVYKEDPPTSGPHRPIWPIYGEYQYCPPQRWLHNLEHGAVVLLFHPCAKSSDVDLLKSLVKGCLRRHIITPYRFRDPSQPFALVAWGYILKMSYADIDAAKTFIQKYAFQKSLPEHAYAKEGQYAYGLLHKAQIVTNFQDCVVCPTDPGPENCIEH